MYHSNIETNAGYPTCLKLVMSGIHLLLFVTVKMEAFDKRDQVRHKQVCYWCQYDREFDMLFVFTCAMQFFMVYSPWI